jgi:hypothetical protein
VCLCELLFQIYKFLECFLKNIKYILNNNSLVSFVEDGNGRKVFESIVMEPWLNLVCSVYLNSALYAGQTLERFRDSFMTSPLDDECVRLLGWVGRQRMPGKHE